ncbi:beta-propeller domain-containing protein [Massilia sp. W12]|uniref:beta-propeller domain-containing protein n=1 Tax=Massilia sp. W12 TaxID=3126507 RepID=UPI0030D5C545
MNLSLHYRLARRAWLLLSTALLSACGGGGGTPAPAPTQLLSGKTEFVSARPNSSINADLMTMQSATANASANARKVEEGDIYRVLDDGKTIVNLNQHRGLQVIDIANPAQPKILGRLALPGNPVEMYRQGEKLYVLQNNWQEYRRLRQDGKESLENYAGGALLVIDISQRTAPRQLQSVRMPGYIQTSRLASGAGQSALYVAAFQYAAAPGSIGGMQITNGEQAVLQSFALDANGLLQEKSRLNLSGYLQVLQANGERLLAARLDFATQSSQISLIDISRADGVMSAGGVVTAKGMVTHKRQLHIQDGILRVVSARTAGLPENHVQTFDISNLAAPKAVDAKTFGAGQSLFATTFLPDRAFFVTYLRQDPFHSFSISPGGVLREEAEFVVSGWNDFFAPVNNHQQLIGIGVNDANNKRKLALSLYDIRQLNNPNPLLMRAEVELDSAWSNANWDDKAFSVLENAANVLAADGVTRETGLALLPFSGWNTAAQTYQHGVQIFSFSATTLSKRGVMLTNEQAERSFMPQSAQPLAAALSHTGLALFDASNPNHPVARGSLSLARNISQFSVIGQTGVRYHARSRSWGSAANPGRDQLELVQAAQAGQVDSAAALSVIEVAPQSTIHNAGGKLAVLHTEVSPASTAQNRKVLVSLTLFDVSNPAQPRELGRLLNQEISLAASPYILDCMSVDICGGVTLDVRVIGDAILLAGRRAHSEGVGEASRHWQSYEISVIDLRNPAAPLMLPDKIISAADQEAVTLHTDGAMLWLNYRKNERADAAGMPQAKYWLQRYDFSTPQWRKVGQDVNLPGELAGVAGNQLYSKDFHWSGGQIEQSLNQSTLQGDLAYLQASLRNSGQSWHEIALDGARVLASGYRNAQAGKPSVEVYTVQNKAFVLENTIAPPSWTSLRYAKDGKLLLSDWYGVLLFDYSQSNQAYAQAWHAGAGYNGLSVHNNQVYLPAGLGGIVQFDLQSANLNAP